MTRLIAPVLLGVAAFSVAPFPASTTAAQADARERTLYTSVLDKQGEPVTGLGADDFIVREDNVRREVLRVTPATEPIAIAVLIDNSAAAEPEIRNIRDGLTKFVNLMHAGNAIALIGIGDRPTILQDYTSNAELLKEGIGRVFAQPGSGMTLLEAIVETSRGLRRREEPRAAIVAVLTDGQEFSNLHYNQVLEPLNEAAAAFHVLAIGTFAPSFEDAQRNRATVLDAGPRQSGGQRHTLLSSMAVPGTFERLARELKSQYKVVYSRPESLIQPETVTVSVRREGLSARGTPERREKPGL